MSERMDSRNSLHHERNLLGKEKRGGYKVIRPYTPIFHSGGIRGSFFTSSGKKDYGPSPRLQTRKKREKKTIKRRRRSVTEGRNEWDPRRNTSLASHLGKKGEAREGIREGNGKNPSPVN